MSKVKMGPTTLAYPMPAFLVGADVEDRANFLMVAWGGIACGTPPMISVAIKHDRYTLKGIRQKGTFSVNVPPAGLVAEADFCGIVTGAKYDKPAVCGFSVFYGQPGSAPMIEECPVNFECKVEHSLDLGSHVLVVGSIQETFVSEDCLTGGKPDVSKIRPFLYSSGLKSEYLEFGGPIAPAFKKGREIKKKITG